MKGTSCTNKEYALLRICSLPVVVHVVMQLVTNMTAVYTTVSVIWSVLHNGKSRGVSDAVISKIAFPQIYVEQMMRMFYEC
jgi:hypothetical protein